MSASPDIFLSYNREDADVARRFAEGFEAQGFDVWWDQALRSGEAYDEVTEAALRGAKAVVVLWSPRSVVSRWVRAEATLADRNRTLVPARIAACDLPIMFELTQTAELSRWDGNHHDEAWLAFLEDVRQILRTETSNANLDASLLPANAESNRRLRSARPSIAVLPFVNRSGIAEDDIFADCMAEDLTAALATSRRMKVTATSATSIYRTGRRDLARIACELGVSYFLEGNVRRVGKKLLVTAQLVEGESSDILWTQKFDRPLAEMAELQEDLAMEVAAHLGAEVQRVEMEHALRKPNHKTAWEAVLRSDAQVARWTLAGAHAAVEEARRAVEIDPNFGAARAAYAASLGYLYETSGGSDAELEQKTLAEIAHALELEPGSPIALCRIAGAYKFLNRMEEALPFAERAVTISPNLEAAHLGLASIFTGLGRWDEALAECEATIRLAPRGFWFTAALGNKGRVLYHTGRLEEALETFENSLRLYPQDIHKIQRILCLGKLDRWQQAAEAMQAFRDSKSEISLQFIENNIRNNLHSGRNLTKSDDDIAILRRLWEETGGDA